jgi:hypothetical protein
MKILNLIIRQKYFDAIMAGRKVKEYREVRPTTVKKYIQLDSDGYEKEDKDGNAIPIHYDAIRFYVGYEKDRDTALVEVKGEHSEAFVDDNGKPIIYEYGGETWVSEQVVYDLGKILEHNIREQSRKVKI